VAQNLLHHRLRQKHRAFDARGFEFLPAANVHQADAARLAQSGQFRGGNLQFLVLLVAGLDVLDDFGDVQVVARAQSRPGFRPAETRNWRSRRCDNGGTRPVARREKFQHARHGRLRIDGIGHSPKNF
jgi:hypothetical protein